MLTTPVARTGMSLDGVDDRGGSWDVIWTSCGLEAAELLLWLGLLLLLRLLLILSIMFG